MNNNFRVIIPARLQSGRLTDKMRIDIHGLPLIVRTAKQALKSNAKSVTVATDDKSIMDICLQHNIPCILTNSDHQTGTDRLVEAVNILQYTDDQIIINVQGDEPLIEPQVINNLAKFIIQQQTQVATIAHKITTENEVFNPSIVKVVLDHSSNAMYFSRAPIPYSRDGFATQLDFTLPKGINFLRHIGMYAYTVEFLKNYGNMPSSLIENVEKLEQLRILYNGHKLSVLISNIIPEGGVDTLEDLQRVRQVIANQEISGKGSK
ncbi:MAG: 3-deoxy-manno-octulosonate cytidylyltransferase [Burkholderiales bacterium]|nr:3-deoxy-manno-octulosonate cytidylyltransferase [Burkholderiales bacterium]